MDVVFVARLPTNRPYQGNRRISRIALRGNAASELEQPQHQKKKKNRENKKRQRGL